MKLVIDLIGTPGDMSRSIVNLDNISVLTLKGTPQKNTSGDEQLVITYDDGSVDTYMTCNYLFGLPDGHGGIAAKSPQEIMDAYLELDMKGADEI